MQQNENQSPELNMDTAEACEQPDQGLQKQLEEALAQREEYLNLAQRVQADFDNYRRRNNAACSEAYDNGRHTVIEQMLPVLDNLERAVDSAKEKATREGISLVLRQMLELMQKWGVECIDRTGEVFDPRLENAVLQGGPEEGEPGTVCLVMQKGYRIGSRVLRHAMVKVVAE